MARNLSMPKDYLLPSRSSGWWANTRISKIGRAKMESFGGHATQNKDA